MRRESGRGRFSTDPVLLEACLLESAGEEVKSPTSIVYFILLGVAFTGNLLISLLAPFLPPHLRQLKLSQGWCGPVFSSFPVAVLVATPVAVYAISRFGRVRVLSVGLLVQGSTTWAFGYSDWLTGGPGRHAHADLCVYMFCRLACGIGGALANNAVFALAADQFPDTLGRVMGYNEVAIGLGFTLGPPLGSALYAAGGFALPFAVAGTAVLAILPMSLLLKQPRSEVSGEEYLSPTSRKNNGLTGVLTLELLIVAGSLLLGTSIFGAVEATLSLHLQDDYGESRATVAALFSVLAGTYSIAGPFVGALADRVSPGLVSVTGCLSSGLVLMFALGPTSKRLPLKRGGAGRLEYNSLSLCILGITQAATIIPTLPAMQATARKATTKEGQSSVTDRVVAWFNIFLQLGLVVGPFTGTGLTLAVGFEVAVGLYGLVVVLYGAFVIMYFLLRERTEAGFVPPRLC